MSKKILYVGEMEFPDKNAAAHRVLANCEIIKASTQHEVVLIGLSRALNSTCMIEESNKISSHTVFQYKYPNTPTEWFKYITSIKYIENIVNVIGIEYIDAIIAYNYPAIALNKLRIYCGKNNIKIISDTSEWYGKSKRSFPSNIVKDFDTFLRMRIINATCKNLICASKYLENYYSAKKCNVVNIPSLVKETHYSNEIGEENQVLLKHKIFSFVGSPGKSKEKERLDWIINFFHKVKDREDFRLILVGVTKELLIYVYPNLENQIKGLNNKIIFKGKLPHSEAIETISHSDFTVFARMSNRVTNAGFPTKLSESFSCGIPVVTTPSSNVSDFIEEGRSGFIASKCDSKSFEIALLKALNCNPLEINNMKTFVKENNPLKLKRFYEGWKEFYYGEEE